MVAICWSKRRISLTNQSGLDGAQRQAVCVCACGLSNRGLTNLRLQDFDFKRQAVKLCQFARQKANCQARFFGDACWGQQVGVGQFVGAFVKALHFDEALTKQRFEAIVGFAQTDAQSACKVALAQVRVGLQEAQDLEVVFVLQGGGRVGVHWLNADAST